MINPFTKIRKLERQLTAAQAEILKLSQDCVSGLWGRTTFEERLEAMSGHHRQRDSIMAIIMCDIDHFKVVNDTHGHRIGDQVISRVATTIRGQTRTTDIVARYGGEEFVCLLTGTSLKGVAILSERIRHAVQGLEHPGCPQVTISVGFALQAEPEESGWSVVERADQSLYRAKGNGRNCVQGENLSYPEIVKITILDTLERLTLTPEHFFPDLE